LIGFAKDRRISFTSHTVWFTVYLTWLTYLHTQSTAIYLQQLLVQHKYCSSGHWKQGALKLDPHPALHNAIVFQYWFRLVGFAKERKASFTSHNCKDKFNYFQGSTSLLGF
jgi:hypothetical protein